MHCKSARRCSRRVSRRTWSAWGATGRSAAARAAILVAPHVMAHTAPVVPPLELQPRRRSRPSLLPCLLPPYPLPPYSCRRTSCVTPAEPPLPAPLIRSHPALPAAPADPDPPAPTEACSRAAASYDDRHSNQQGAGADRASEAFERFALGTFRRSAHAARRRPLSSRPSRPCAENDARTESCQPATSR